MSKKIVSVLLVISLIFSFCSVNAFATEEKTMPGVSEIESAISKDFDGAKKSASLLMSLSKSLMKNLGPYVEEVVLTPENTEKAKQAVSKVMAKLIDKITKPSEPSEPSKPEEPSNPSDPSKPSEPVTPEKPSKDKISIKELKAMLKRYIFVKVDDADAAALDIVKKSDIKYALVTDKDGTVYISVDIKENPEIFNYSVFKNVVDGLYAAQGEELLKNNNGETDYAMSYEHIAGELALHAIIYAVTNEIINVTGTKNSFIIKMYDKAVVAALNYDENRLPTEVFAMLGVLLVDLFQFNLLKLFGVL